MRKWLTYVVLSVLLIGLATILWLVLSRPALTQLPQLKSGDIVLQTLSTQQTLAILYATQSPYSHIGIISYSNYTPW